MKQNIGGKIVKEGLKIQNKWKNVDDKYDTDFINRK
jgi:hypothetical protein